VRLLVVLISAFCTAACSTDRSPNVVPVAATECSAVFSANSRQALPGTVIKSVVLSEAGVGRGGLPALPAHCVVTAEFGARTGVDGVRYATTFELRLPLHWNGRFQFMGGGGTDGSVRPAYGFAQNGSRPALADGFAVVSSDFGHQATDPRDASFGLDPQARIDWGYQSQLEVATRAKTLLRIFYSRAPMYSYYAGCSGGGRQALMMSQRFADEFDGIFAGSPILEQHVAQIGSMQILQEFTAIAPPGTDGKPVLSRSFSDADLRLIQRDVLNRCDANDGLADGIIENPDSCRYNPAPLQCAGERTTDCLSAAQVSALTRVLAGPRNSRGVALYEPYPIDAGVLTWRAAMLGTSDTGTSNASRATNTSVKYVFMTPPQPQFDYLAFNFDTDPARLSASAAFSATNTTDYGAFRQRSGKAIITMGTGDGLLNANGVRRWYQKLVEANGGIEQTQRFARYFQVPGMGHCSGGPSLDHFQPFEALVAWVEQGRAPAELIATGAAFPGRKRPLCAYPKIARYRGTGSADLAENFRCE
jgi:Tannase and feruloyl esterase